MKKKTAKEITDYDKKDTTPFIDRAKKMRLHELGITLPREIPMKALSNGKKIRIIPSRNIH